MHWKLPRAPVLSLVAMACASCGLTTPPGPPVVQTIRYDARNEEETVIIEGMPSFTLRGQTNVLVLDTRGKYKLESSDLPPWEDTHHEVDPGKPLRVEVLRQVIGRGEDGSPGIQIRDISRVSQGDRMLSDCSLCTVHRIPMKRQLEDITSHDNYPRSFHRRRERLFPNDGGAYLMCGGGLRRLIWACPECERLSAKDREHL